MIRQKIKLVPLTANNLTTDIINRLNSDGHVANRVNSLGVWDPRGFYRKPKASEKGKSDIIACLAPIGLYAGIEVKIGDDEQSKHQQQFEKRILAAGGKYIAVKNQADFLAWYEKTKKLITYLEAATQYL